MMIDVLHGCMAGVEIRYHTKSKLFNVNCLQSKAKLLIQDLLYADDYSKVTQS